MTTEEAAALIEGAVPSPDGSDGAVWADLGAGSGTFTLALARLLSDDARILAVDREVAAIRSLERTLERWREEEATLPSVTPFEGDFREPGELPALAGETLDGALFANALHFDPDASRTLSRFAERLAPGGRLVIVEYQDRPPNPWVPHPLPLERLRELADDEGLTPPRMVGERPSSYGGFLYCAWTGRG